MNDIAQRIVVANLLIKMLERDSDPRVPALIAEIERQRELLKGMLPQAESTTVAATQYEGKPPPVVVGLKPLTLRGKVGGTNGRG